MNYDPHTYPDQHWIDQWEFLNECPFYPVSGLRMKPDHCDVFDELTKRGYRLNLVTDEWKHGSAVKTRL